jgi:alpha-tubulin suppressor-like RCC1 family protein
MLNAQVKAVYSNDKFSLYLSTDCSTIYSTGYDYRQVDTEDLNGIPRQLSLSSTVLQISVGKDHALFLTEENHVFAFGSNHYG